MKLNEITKIAQQPAPGFDINDFDLENEKQIATAENIPLYHLKGGPKNRAVEAYALKINNQYVSILIGEYGTFNGPAFFILRSWTIPSMRNKGLVTSLYYALCHRLHIKLVSDTQASPETLSVWAKLKKTIPIKVYNPNTNQLLDLSDVLEQDLYNPDLKMRLVTESVRPICNEHICIPERPLLGGILEDYIMYTDEKDYGKYI